MTRVVLYTAEGCSLCERALDVIRGARHEFGFELAVVDIGGVAELESRYRELIPVVEIGGERAFTFFVDADALRRRLAEAVPATAVETPLAES
jgi:glutaredoxin